MSNDNAPTCLPGRPRLQFPMKPLAICLKIIATLSVAVVFAGLFGKWNWLLDLGSHFRVQAAFSLVVCGGLLLLLKRLRWGLVSLVAGLGLTATLWPFYSPTPPAAKDHTYRLLSLNVLSTNPQHGRVIDFILESNPDFIVLQEVKSSWIESLDAVLKPTWPHRKSFLRFDDYGVALYSKLPWITCEKKRYSNFYSTPALAALIELADGSKLRLITVHPASPMNYYKWESRNKLFENLAKDVQTPEHGHTIVAGDLNCTPWSYWYRQLIKESGLRNAADGKGFHVTWMPIRIGICGLPIDHVLVGPEIEVTRFSVGPYVGSDHRGLVVDFE